MQRKHFAIAWIVAFAVACGSGDEASKQAASGAKPEPPLDALPTAVLVVRDMGEIRLALRPDVAPATVANFQKLADAKFYDGTTFHRVIPEFMIQGGDPNTKDRDPRNDGHGGPGWRIPDERSGISHLRGVVSMANTGPNSGGSQFFIMVAGMPELDMRHTTFGRVISGMEVVDAIVVVERDQFGRHGPLDRPIADVVIESLRVEPPKAPAP